MVKVNNTSSYMDEDKKETILIDEELLRSKIYEVRGQKVMLDVDFAEIYALWVK